MEELIVNILLMVIIAAAIVLRFFIGSRKNSGMTKKQKTMLARILIATAMLLGLQFLTAEIFNELDGHLFPSAGRLIRFACYLIDYFVIGYDILKKALKGIRNRQVFDENFLMAVATVGAMALAIHENGEYLEAITVMLLYQVVSGSRVMLLYCAPLSFAVRCAVYTPRRYGFDCKSLRRGV